MLTATVLGGTAGVLSCARLAFTVAAFYAGLSKLTALQRVSLSVVLQYYPGTVKHYRLRILALTRFRYGPRRNKVSYWRDTFVRGVLWSLESQREATTTLAAYSPPRG